MNALNMMQEQHQDITTCRGNIMIQYSKSVPDNPQNFKIEHGKQ